VESKLGPLGTSAIYWPIVPAPGDCENGEFGGMNGRGNRSTRRKPAPPPLYPPQIPLDQTRYWTRAAAVGSQRITASAMARPCKVTYFGWRAPRWQRLAEWRPSWFYSMEAQTNIAFGCTVTKCVTKCFFYKYLFLQFCWLLATFSVLQFLVVGFSKLSVLLPGSTAVPFLRSQLTC
jgi:hypothetical protein